MMRAAALVVLLLLGNPAWAQLAEETASVALELRRALPEPKGSFEVGSYKGRYAYEVACFRHLLPLNTTIQRCVEAQRMASGEFGGRLDFFIESGGRLERFASGSEQLQQLQACLMPHVLALHFPSFGGQRSTYQLQMLVASPGLQLGRHLEAKPVAVYPVTGEEERRAYHQAIGWVFSPWSQAIGHCAELADQQLGFGYRVRLEIAVSPAGRANRARLEVRGKLASRAAPVLAACVTPFVRAMSVPSHAGKEPFLFRFGTRTVSWGSR